MNPNQLATLKVLVGKLAVILASLTTLLGVAPAHSPAPVFGTSANVSAPSTNAVGTPSCYTTFNSSDGSYTLGPCTGNTFPGPITNTNPAQPSQIYTLLTSNVIFGGIGTPTTYTTTTTVTPQGFCAVSNLVIMNSTSGVTSTINFPTLAAIQSSTPATGGCGPLNPGGKELQMLYNSSTANLVVNASSGIVFKNATTSAWLANSSSSITIPAGGVMEEDGTDINASLFFVQNTQYN